MIALRSFSHRLTLVKSAMLVFFETFNGVNTDTHGIRIGYHTCLAGVHDSKNVGIVSFGGRLPRVALDNPALGRGLPQSLTAFKGFSKLEEKG